MIKLDSYLNELQTKLCTLVQSSFDAKYHFLINRYLEEIDFENIYYYNACSLCISKQFYHFALEYSFNDNQEPTLSTCSIFEMLISHFEILKEYIAIKYVLYLGYSYASSKFLENFSQEITLYAPTNLHEQFHLTLNKCYQQILL